MSTLKRAGHQGRRVWLALAATVGLVLLQVGQAFANAGSVMPWNTPLENLLANLTGPTATTIGAIAIVAAVIAWAVTKNVDGVVGRGVHIIAAVAACMGVVPLMGALALSGAVV